MKPIELFRRAVDEIGDASAAELSEHLEKKHGVKIEPAYIPLFKATLKHLKETNQLYRGEKSEPKSAPHVLGSIALVEPN